MSRKIYENLAQALGLWCKVESDRWCDLVDVKNNLSMSIEFSDSRVGERSSDVRETLYTFCLRSSRMSAVESLESG